MKKFATLYPVEETSHPGIILGLSSLICKWMKR